ncbi:MAG: phosphatase PAP2 family protein [Caldicoprobacterales bacterium]
MELMQRISEYVISLRNPLFDWFFTLVTMLGEVVFFTLVVAILYWCIDKDWGFRLGFAYLFSGLANTWIKEICRVPRPFELLDIDPMRVETAGGYSFPSGHTQQASSLLIVLMEAIKKKWFYILASLLIILVAFSRIYLGVHWAFDVVGGIIIALLCVLLSNWLYSLSKAKKTPEIMGIMIIPLLVGLFIFKTSTYYTVGGTLTGLFIGYILDTRFIKYKSGGPLLKQLAKCLIGIVGLLIIKLLIEPGLAEGLGTDFFVHGLLSIWLTVLAPLLFRLVLRDNQDTGAEG